MAVCSAWLSNTYRFSSSTVPNTCYKTIWKHIAAVRLSLPLSCRRRLATTASANVLPLPDQILEVHAIKTAANYNLTRLDAMLQRQSMFEKQPLLTELQHSVRLLRLAKDTMAAEHDHPRLFIFSTGTIVSWGHSENVLQALMTLIRPVESESLSSTVVAQEREVLQYQVTSKPPSLRNGVINISSQAEEDALAPLDESQVERESLMSNQIEDRKIGMGVLSQLSFSHALSTSVELGVLEAELSQYAHQMEWITTDIKEGRKIKISRHHVLQLYGGLLSLRHDLNRSSDMNDFYWDREPLERLYEATCRFLDVEARRRLCNERINYHSELVELLRITLSERHTTLLEQAIIALIMIEVLFECIHYAERWMVG
eukprot:m.161163 g.161163  ORF g.161163 m.161163 type:complete len:372 (+) comp16518_c0_seq3:3635-4750(+)